MGVDKVKERKIRNLEKNSLSKTIKFCECVLNLLLFFIIRKKKKKKQVVLKQFSQQTNLMANV